MDRIYSQLQRKTGDRHLERFLFNLRTNPDFLSIGYLFFYQNMTIFPESNSNMSVNSYASYIDCGVSNSGNFILSFSKFNQVSDSHKLDSSYTSAGY